jgi:5'-AMP-activated protein kinase catalytic alpha subunit
LGIVHRDLKPENLLLTKDHLLKIIDFGLSNYFVEGQEELLSTPCGSPCYASPEMVSGKKYNGFKIDIWATGIILFAMLCGYLPFENKDNEILFDQILECKVEFPEYLSEESKDLISKILVVDPETRIDIPGIKKHSFFLKGKNFFEQIFTIRRIYTDENENENNEVRNTLEINEENKNKDETEIEVLENKENINLENIDMNNKNEEIIEKNSNESKKMVNNDKKYTKDKKEDSNDSKNKNDRIIKRIKDLKHKKLRQKDKKKK